jgi:hypothetical protein
VSNLRYLAISQEEIMSNEIIAALITIIGGLLAVFLNIFFAREKVKAETRKITLEADEIQRKQERETLENSLRKVLGDFFSEDLLNQLASKTADRIVAKVPEIYSSTLSNLDQSYLKVNENYTKIVNHVISKHNESLSQIIQALRKR